MGYPFPNVDSLRSHRSRVMYQRAYGLGAVVPPIPPVCPFRRAIGQGGYHPSNMKNHPLENGDPFKRLAKVQVTGDRYYPAGVTSHGQRRLFNALNASENRTSVASSTTISGACAAK